MGGTLSLPADKNARPEGTLYIKPRIQSQFGTKTHARDPQAEKPAPPDYVGRQHRFHGAPGVGVVASLRLRDP